MLKMLLRLLMLKPGITNLTAWRNKMFKVTISREIPEQQILDILTTAVEQSIAYWMNEDSTDVEIKRDDDFNVKLVRFRSSYDGTEKVYTVRPDTICTTINMMLNSKCDVAQYILDTIAKIGTDDFDSSYDAETADVIFQMACFGVLVYG